MGLDNPLHIAFLVVILLLVFGAKRLPEIGRSLGGGMREFKDSISGEVNKPTLSQTAQPPQAAPQQAQAASQQQAAQAFGATEPQPVAVPVEQPSQQA
jgi:sec-independent protein translocase protein TatA